MPIKYSVRIQYKPEGSDVPLDDTQDQHIESYEGDYVPLPDVGDSLSYSEGGKIVARKVLTRHFAFIGDWCVVNLVVTDLTGEEYLARLKEQ